MTVDPQLIQRIVELVRAAPLEERDAVIEAACKDNSELRAQVEASLQLENVADDPQTAKTIEVGSSAVSEAASTDQDASEMHPTQPSRRPTAEASTAFHAPTPAKSTVIADRYRLEEKIGEGGMGEVWVAQQSSPVKRKVAVKLIKAGMDSKAVLTRFDQERQALAIMDHPNIAKVYDANVTHSNHPFFVMELVKGKPLTDYCDAARLSPRDRLELFVPICQAVQHAHQKGIVHRDLKPANILVTVVDGKPVPKVIDFGVAKATSGKLTEETLSTGFGAVLGTLEYMSPEQAGTTTEDIDTRSDVYSLGVVLYELLTGLRPFETEQLKKAALSEMIRIIREDDPTKPSTRLSTDANLPSLAAVRRTEPKRLMAELRGELDWVIMKCLEKDRERRYPSASGLARDISRFLANEPVEARPPSATYRFHKFVSRHRGAVAAASLILISLVVGIIGTTLGLMEASKQAAIASDRAHEAELAQQGEAEQRKLAEDANAQAVRALESFTSELMENLLGSKNELSETERAVLQSAQEQWEVFANAKGNSAAAREARATGAQNIGKIQSKLGMDVEAEANLRKALTIFVTLAAEYPDDNQLQSQLARANQSLGGRLRSSGKRAESEQYFMQAVEIYETLSKHEPAEPEHQAELSESFISLGNVHRDFRDWEASRVWYLKANSIQQQLVEQYSESIEYLHSLARSHWGLAFLAKRREDRAESSRNYQRAIELYGQLRQREPDFLPYRLDAANIEREFGVMLSGFRDEAGGAVHLAKAVPIQESIAEDFPSIPSYQLDFARSLRDYGQVLRYLGRYGEAAKQLDQSTSLFEKLVEDHPTILSYQTGLGICYRIKGDLVRKTELAEGLRWYQKAIAVLQPPYQQDKSVAPFRGALSNAYRGRAMTLDLMKRHADATEDWERALELCHEEDRYTVRCQQADSMIHAGLLEQAIPKLNELAEVENESWGHWARFAKLYGIAGRFDPDHRDDYIARAMSMLNRAVELGLVDYRRLDQDEDLEILRDQEEFQQLAQRIRAAASADEEQSAHEIRSPDEKP